MGNKFVNGIKKVLLEQIKDVIETTKRECEENKEKISAIDLLLKVNKNIDEWTKSLEGVINIDEELESAIIELKAPLIDAAKNEVALHVAEIIRTENSNVTIKINEYMASLKDSGLNFEGTDKKEERHNKETQNKSLKLKKTLPKNNERKKTTSSYTPSSSHSTPSTVIVSDDCDPCGGGGSSSGCCGESPRRESHSSCSSSCDPCGGGSSSSGCC